MANPKAIARRKPQRLAHYDYASAGAYFFTICTNDRQHLLGSIIAEGVQLTPAGEIAKRTWLDLPQHYSLIKLDEFIVMPNHVHGILWLTEKPYQLQAVGEGLRPSPTNTQRQPGLTELIRAFKSFSAREINKLRKTTGSVWQRGFYEHIVRNDNDLYQHRAYIQNNPLKWTIDEYYA
ncbi:MAG: transposase [Anaerolineales bacterium]|nr:transposase [Anaerolineales bacterium]